jgi:hypothetical protein
MPTRTDSLLVERELTFALAFGRLGVSPNERMHWAQRSRINGDVRQWAWFCARQMIPRGGGATSRRRVHFEVIWPRSKRRLPDADGLVTQLKPVLDGLVQAKWLVDDSEKWCEQTMPTQRKGVHTGHVKVIATITPLVEPSGAPA